MKTKAEVEEVIGHIVEAVGAPIAKSDSRKTAMMLVVLDALNWVVEKPNLFEAQVVQPCRHVDRARRAKNN